jgi:glycosyltransferase involved in cell wall biosynthesis
MKIAFLSTLDPHNIKNWSGTLYYIFKHLETLHTIEWIENDIMLEINDFHLHHNKNRTFYPEEYAQLFGKLLSERFDTAKYDVIIARDYYSIAYLRVNVPIIYIGDTTFDLYKICLRIEDDKFLSNADDVEKRAINNSNIIIYSSEWAKNNAIGHYGANPEKVKVIEFGANIDKIPLHNEITGNLPETCQLLFIGKDGYRKGIDKTYKTYLYLKSAGFQCHLTIIGCTPPIEIDSYDENITIIPYIDKSVSADVEMLRQILSKTHFFILPTRFECFGIVFCEVAAYGIPSLATNVCGVSQVITDGKNGFLFADNAEPKDYAEKIKSVFEDKVLYSEMRLFTRKEFDGRLNWKTWTEKMNSVLMDCVQVYEADEEPFYIPTYVINLKERPERKEHMIKEFAGRDEFQLNIVEACTHPIGAIGLWQSIVKVIRMAVENDDDVIVLCEDDHYFTENYSKDLLIKCIIDAHNKGADTLSGGIGGFGCAIPVSKNMCWVDWLWCLQFTVIYKKFYQSILDYKFQDGDTTDGAISKLSTNKLAVYPFISRQKDFGYSDVTESNNNQNGLITWHFNRADSILSGIYHIYNHYK